MRLTKEEMEKYKEEAEDMGRKLQVEIVRREEVKMRQNWGFKKTGKLLLDDSKTTCLVSTNHPSLQIF